MSIIDDTGKKKKHHHQRSSNRRTHSRQKHTKSTKSSPSPPRPVSLFDGVDRLPSEEEILLPSSTGLPISWDSDADDDEEEDTGVDVEIVKLENLEATYNEKTEADNNQDNPFRFGARKSVRRSDSPEEPPEDPNDNPFSFSKFARTETRPESIDLPDVAEEDEKDEDQVIEWRIRCQKAEAAILELEELVDTWRTRAQRAEVRTEKLKRREKQETRQLQEVVESVEMNLKAATARADRAEAKVKLLETELMSRGQSSPDFAQVGDWSVVRHKSGLASKQLHQAANEAEQGIRNLMRGVSSLREIASLLTTLDRVATLHDSEVSS